MAAFSSSRIGTALLRRAFWWLGFVILVLPLGAPACVDGGGPAATPTPTTGIGGQQRTIEPVAEPPAGGYLFIETWTIIDGEGTLPRIFIDFPDYRFDSATGALRSFNPSRAISLPVEHWGFIGRGESRRNAAGSGAFSSLQPMPGLPITTTVAIFTGQLMPGTPGPTPEELRDAAVRILAVDADGAIDVDIDGERMVLPPKGQWTKLVEANIVTIRYVGQYRVTSLVTNFGWQDRALINAER